MKWPIDCYIGKNLNKDYPNNHFKPQVVENIEQYRSALFQGDDNTRTLWFDDDKIADEQAIKAIEKIAKSKTASSQTAEKFVNLINASETLWQQMPKPSRQYPEDNSPDSKRSEHNVKHLNKKLENLSRKFWLKKIIEIDIGMPTYFQ